MKQSVSSNQKGMVSVIVTIILIILMTLVVLAMSQNANREQRQALDRQLSDQAFYNAESAVNDWADYLYKNPGAPDEKTVCNTDSSQPGFPSGFPGKVPNPSIDGPDGVNSYTCILYDKAPAELIYDNVNTNDSIVVPITPFGLSGSSEMRSLKFTWRAAEGGTNTSGCNVSGSTLPQSLNSSGNCNVGGLRIDLINSNGTRGDIINNNFPAYLLPSDGGGSITYAPGSLENQGVIGRADCSSDNRCELTVNNINLANNERLFLHIKSIYTTNDLTITGCHSASPSCSTGNPRQLTQFAEAQISIDATGKANDVLRRIAVRIPAQSQFDTPGSAAIRTTQSICKLVTVSDPARTATIDGRCLP